MTLLTAAIDASQVPQPPLPYWREANAVLCTVCFAVVTWRVIGRWDLMQLTTRVFALLLATLELIVALASARSAAWDAPWNEAQYFITVHGVLTLLIGTLWWRLIDPQRPHEPQNRRTTRLL